jgi:hypothetical protein
MAVFAGPEIPNTGLVVHLDAANIKSYPGTGNQWNDISGMNQHFTLYNSPTYNSQYGGEIRFSSSNDYARIINSTSANLIGPAGSIELIFRTLNGTLSSSNFGRLVSIANNAGTGSNTGSTTGTLSDFSGFLCIARNDVSQNVALWYKNNPAGFSTSPLVNVNTNTYWNLTITWETISTQMTFNFYYNGTLQGGPTTVTNSGFTGATTITLAANSSAALTGPVENSDIAISSFKAYNRTLTAAEIAQNYEAMRGRFGV